MAYAAKAVHTLHPVYAITENQLSLHRVIIVALYLRTCTDKYSAIIPSDRRRKGRLTTCKSLNMGIHPSGGGHDPCVWQSVRGLNLEVQVTRSHIMRVLHLVLDESQIP